MNNLKTPILIIIAIIIPVLTFSQTQTESYYIRKINLRILDKISQYENFCSLRNQDKVYDFKDLFINDSLQIFNDVMPDNNLNHKVDINKYINLINIYYSKPSIRVTVNVKEISKINFNEKNEGALNVDAEKIISIITRQGISYLDTFKIRFSFLADFKNEYYKITDINLTEPKGKYYLIEANSKSLLNYTPLANEKLLINHNEIILDDKGLFLLKNIKPDSQIVFQTKNPDIPWKVKINTSQIKDTINNSIDKNLVKINFRQSLFNVQLYLSGNPMNMAPVKYKGDKYKIDINNKTSGSIGVNLGALIKKTNKGYWKLIVGAGYESLSFQIKSSQFIYSFLTTDIENSQYVRTNNITNITETHNLSYINIHVGTEKGIKINSNYNFYCSFYLSLLKNINSQHTTNAIANYSGLYDTIINNKHYSYILSNNAGADFGKINLNNKGQEMFKLDWVSCYEINMGIIKRIMRQYSLSAGISYQGSFNYIYKENQNTNNHLFESLTSLSKLYKINLFSVNLGLIIKI